MGNQKTPKPETMSHPTAPSGLTSPETAPAYLRTPVAWFEGLPNARDRFRWTLRDALDSLLDGQHTGRWNYLHLSKTEKTHLGTTIEIMLTKELEIGEGVELDWLISGIEVDCKFSKDFGKWQIPLEMYLSDTPGQRSGKADQIALVVWLDDDRGMWAAGLVQIRDHLLSKAKGQGDKKRVLNAEGLKSVHWLWGGPQNDLPDNQLLHLSEEARQRIFGASKRSGQKRINALLREFNGQVVHRTTVLTVAQQADGMKRPRDSRLSANLGKEGFLVLGHQGAHPHISRRLNLPVATKGDFVPIRVVQVEPDAARPKVYLGELHWAVANASEGAGAAPAIPEKRPQAGWEEYLSQ